MNLFLKTVNLLSLILSLLLLQSCQPVVSEGMLNDQGSYPDEIILVDALQLSSETGSSHPAFTVKLVDRINNPVPNANISLLTTSGSAFASSLKTNNIGEVDITWNFGYQVGLQQLRIIAELNGYITNKVVSIFLNQSSPSASLSTITGTTNIPADGLSQSTITITIRNSSGIGIAGIYPTFSATDTGDKNLYTNCTETNAGGVSLCTLRSRAAEIKTLQILTPVSKTGGTTAFITLTPLAAIGFSTQPAAGTTDDDFIIQPIVTGYDAFGEVDTTNITSVIDLTAYSGPSCSGSVIASSLGGSSSVLMDEGVATFTDLRPLKTSIKSLKATTGSLSACSNVVNVTPGAPSQIALNSGDAQEAEVTSELNPFIALVTDANDNPVPNATVNWSITSGAGALSTSSSLSDSSGLASSTLTLGTVAEDYTVEATLDGTTESVTFLATGSAAQPATIEIDSGDLQTGSVGSPLVAELAVIVKDAHGNLVPNIQINWSNTTGAGSLAASSSTTDQNGIAKVIYTLGTVAGLNEVTATVINQAMLNVTFSATGEALIASQIEIISGNNQSGTISSALGAPMVVRVSDTFNNVIENTTIDWITTAGTLTATPTTTDVAGESSNNLTLDTTAGAYTVTATINGTAINVNFSHTATLSAPSNLAGIDGVGNVSLTWDNVSGADSYKVYSSLTSGGPYTEVSGSPALTNNFTHLLNPGETVYIVVTALQGSVESSYSNEISAPTLSSWMTQIGLSLGGYTIFTTSASGDDICKKAFRASDGSTYCAGSTSGSFGEPNGGGVDGFVMKIDPSGSIAWVYQLGAITRHQNGTNSGDEICNSLALSNDNLSVYCAGNTTGSMSETNGGGRDAFVAKLDATNGSLNWVVQLGATNGLNFTQGESPGDDSCQDIVVDEDNDVYCGGFTTNPIVLGSDKEAFILKLNPNGDIQWLTQLNSLSHPDSPHLAIDHSADDSCDALATSGTRIFCAGATQGSLSTTFKIGNDWDIFNLQIDQDGVISRVNQSYSSSGDDYCLSLFYEEVTAKLFCGGKTTGDFAEVNAGGSDALVIAFDPISGNQNWAKQFGTLTDSTFASAHQGDDACLSITSSPAYVYCGGETSGSMNEANAGGKDAFITALTVAGNFHYTKQLGGTSLTMPMENGSGDDSCAGIGIDLGLDQIFCIGQTAGHLTLNNGNFGTNDVFVATMQLPTGDLVLIDQLGQSFTNTISINRAGQEDKCVSVTQDNAGNVYCAGHTYGYLGETNAGGADAFIMKTNKNGEVQWITQLGEETLSIIGGDGSGNDFCTGIALDSSGNIFCAGYTDGDLKENNAGGNDVFIVRLDTDGNVDWINHLGDTTSFSGGDNSGDDKCHAIAIDTSNDEIYCAGETYAMGEANAGGSDAVVFKFESDGTPAWAYQIGNTATVTAPIADKAQDDAFHALSIGSSGSIFVSGSTLGNLFANSNGESDAIIINLDAVGVRQWGNQIGGTGSDRCRGVAVNTNDSSVYCGGSTTSSLTEMLGGIEDAFVAKFDLSSGVNSWISQLGVESEMNGPGSHGGAESCYTLALDGTGNIYCAGGTTGYMGEANGGGKDAFIAKIDSSGFLQDIFQLGTITTTSGSSDQDESCLALNITASGEMICAGTTKGNLTDTNGAGMVGNTNDILIFKLKSDGTL
jgi:Bacterial Ig-like domain (group 1)/Beta-propeller repeat